MRAKQRASPFWCRQPPALIAIDPGCARFALPKPVRSTILASKPPESGEYWLRQKGYCMLRHGSKSQGIAFSKLRGAVALIPSI